MKLVLSGTAGYKLVVGFETIYNGIDPGRPVLMNGSVVPDEDIITHPSSSNDTSLSLNSA
jgi:hypothetical protein